MHFCISQDAIGYNLVQTIQNPSGFTNVDFLWTLHVTYIWITFQSSVLQVFRVMEMPLSGPTHDGTSLIAQLVKNLPAMQETLVQFLGQESTR